MGLQPSTDEISGLSRDARYVSSTTRPSGGYLNSQSMERDPTI